MRLPVQSSPVVRAVSTIGNPASTGGVLPQGGPICGAACGLLQSACNKIPFVSGSVCTAIYNCCMGACPL